MKKFLLLKIVAIAVLVGSCKIVNIVEKPSKPSKPSGKKYDLIGVFYDDYAPMISNGKYGLLNSAGKEAIPPTYDLIYSNEDASEYWMGIKDNQYALFRNNGSTFFPLKYDDIQYLSENRFAINVAGLYGIVDSLQNEIVPNQYNDIIRFDDSLLFVSTNYQWGILNINTGIHVLPPLYEEIDMNIESYFGLIPVSTGNQWGVFDIQQQLEIITPTHYGVSIISNQYIKIEKEVDEAILVELVNKKNETIIPAQLGTLYSYPDDSTFVILHEAGVKFYNSRGKLIASGEDYNDHNVYDGSIFYEGFISIKENGKWKFVNESGTIPMNKYDGISAIDDKGMAEVCIGCEEIQMDYEHFFVGGKWGIIDTTGKEIVTPKFNDIYSYFVNNLAIVNDSCIIDETYYDCLGGKQGVIDRKGNLVLPLAFDQITFTNSFIYANIGIEHDPVTYSSHGGLYGLFDLSGKEIAPIIYEDIYDFNEENLFKVQKDQRWGLMNYNGQLVTEIIYDEIYLAKSGVFIVSEHGTLDQNGDWQNGQFHLINSKGEKLTKDNYEYLERPYTFDSYVSKKNGKFGVIDDNEVELISHSFDFVTPAWKSGVYYVNVGGKFNSSTQEVEGGTWGLFREGNVCLVKFIYEHIEDVYENGELYILNSNGKFGLCDGDGKILTKTSYDQIVNLYQTVLGVEKDGKIGGLNSKGEVVIPIEYEKSKYGFGNEYFLVNKESNLYHPD